MCASDGIANPQEEVELAAKIQSSRVEVDGRAIHIVHHQVRQAIGGLARIEQAGDAGVLQGSENLTLSQEPIDESASFRIVAEKLDGDALLHLTVSALGQVNL